MVASKKTAARRRLTQVDIDKDSGRKFTRFEALLIPEECSELQKSYKIEVLVSVLLSLSAQVCWGAREWSNVYLRSLREE